MLYFAVSFVAFALYGGLRTTCFEKPNCIDYDLLHFESDQTA